MRWDEPTFLGSADKIGSLALAGRQSWGLRVADATRELPVYAIDRRVNGGGTVHHVNALDPGTEPEGGYLHPDCTAGADVIPAGRR